MTILAQTDLHLAEYGSGILTITRHSDGHCIGIEGRAIAGMFRQCVAESGPEKSIATFIRMAEFAHKRAVSRPGYRSPLGSMDPKDANGWQPLYKPGHVPGADGGKAISPF